MINLLLILIAQNYCAQHHYNSIPDYDRCVADKIQCMKMADKPEGCLR